MISLCLKNAYGDYYQHSLSLSLSSFLWSKRAAFLKNKRKINSYRKRRGGEFAGNKEMANPIVKKTRVQYCFTTWHYCNARLPFIEGWPDLQQSLQISREEAPSGEECRDSYPSLHSAPTHTIITHTTDNLPLSTYIDICSPFLFRSFTLRLLTPLPVYYFIFTNLTASQNSLQRGFFALLDSVVILLIYICLNIFSRFILFF